MSSFDPAVKKHLLGNYCALFNGGLQKNDWSQVCSVVVEHINVSWQLKAKNWLHVLPKWVREICESVSEGRRTLL